MKFSRFEKAALAAVFLLFMTASYYLTAAYAYTGNIFLVPEKLQFLVRNFGWYWTDLTPRGLFAGCGFYAMFFLYVCSKKGNFMRGEEYGRARWASAKEITRKLGDPDPEKNRILTQSLRVSLDTRRTMLNNNLCCIGGSGAGKTKFLVVPNLLLANMSFIFTDPDGGLLREYGRFLEERGYRIVSLNLVNLDKSNCYNPFSYIKKEQDIVRLISNLIANTTPPNSMKGEPFWERAEALFLEALFLYVWQELEPEEQTFNSVLDLMHMAQVMPSGKMSQLDKLFNTLPEDSLAKIKYNACIRGAGDTVRSIFICASARLRNLDSSKGIQRILSRDDIDIPSLGRGVNGTDRKTAVFCIIPDSSDDSYNFIVGMLYTQIFQELYYQADSSDEGRLHIPVAFWMDEFANIALPSNFSRLLSTMRKREICASIILQNIAQIKALFEKEWEGIIGNCDTLLYLGGNEPSTHKYISEELGKRTISKQSNSESKGERGSTSLSTDVMGRELMTQDEVRQLDNGKCICMIRGEWPVLDDKYGTFAAKEYLHALSLGPYKQEKMVDEKGEALPPVHALAFLPNETFAAYKKEKFMKCYEIDLETLFVKDGDESLSEAFDDRIDFREVRKTMEENEEKNRKKEDEMQERSEYRKKSGIPEEDRTRSLIELMRMYPLDRVQAAEVTLAKEHGLTDEEIKCFYDPALPPSTMAEIRKSLEAFDREGGKFDVSG